MKTSLLIAATLIISSCTTVEYIPVDLSGKLPPSLTREQLPTESGLECLVDSEYQAVVRMHKRIQTLRNIILSTKQN